MVVATIARPNLRGSSAADLNRVVEQFAGTGNAQVADWRSATLSTPGLLGRDRTHATARGYALRASLLAEAVQGCLLGGNLGGIPAPEDPNTTVPDAPSGRLARAPAKAPAPAARQAAGEGGDPGPRRCGRSHRLARGLGAGRSTNRGNEEGGSEPVLGAPQD